ncbi:MAG: ABC transporter substrate-binding protein [Armatimonadetes bacterium]|nr:ABC transporter substrate-binding protein [Armatimonadota bacterium]
MRTYRRLLGWPLAVAFAALLSGCPPPPVPPAETPTSGPATAPTTPAPTAPTNAGAGSKTDWGDPAGIAIGGYMSLTGDTATFGQSSNMAMGMAVEEINAKGGVLGGQKLHLTMVDTESKQDVSAIAAQRLIDGKSVVVVGEVASSNSLAAAPKCQAAHVPMLTPSSTNPTVTQKGDYIFRACFTDNQQGAYMALFAAKELKAKRAAILKDISSDYSKGLTEVIQKRFESAGGKILRVEGYQQKETDFSPTLTSLKALNLDAVFVPGYYGEVGLIVKQARELGLKCPFVGGDGWDSPKLAEVAGANLDGSFYVNHYSKEEDRPKVKEFVSGFKQRYGSDPDALAACAYDAIYIVADALNRAGAADSQKLRDALATTQGYDGVTGVITIDAERNASKPCVILGFQNGKEVMKGTMKPTDV